MHLRVVVEARIGDHLEPFRVEAVDPAVYAALAIARHDKAADPLRKRAEHGDVGPVVGKRGRRVRYRLADHVGPYHRRVGLEDYYPLPPCRLGDLCEKAGRLKAADGPTRVVRVYEDDVKRTLPYTLEILVTVVYHDLSPGVGKPRRERRDVRFDSLLYEVIYLHDHHLPDRRVFEDFPQAPAVAAAYDAYGLRVLVRRHRGVHHHLAVRLVVALGEHNRPAEAERKAETVRIEHLNLLERARAAKDGLLDFNDKTGVAANEVLKPHRRFILHGTADKTAHNDYPLYFINNN